MNHPSLSKPLEKEIKRFCAQSNLTPRESEILTILVEGVVRIKDVADRLRLSPNTVNNHVNSIFMKTRTRSKSQLLAGILNHVAIELQKARFFRQTPRVLIVDRDAAAATAIAEVLESGEFRVATVGTSAKALEILNQEKPRFVLADLATLNERGNQFVQAVASLRACSQVVFMGAGAGVNNRCEAMDAGAIDLLNKPIDPGAILQVLMGHFIENDMDRSCYFEMEKQPAKAAIAEVQLTPQNLGVGGIFLSSEDLKRAFGTPVVIGDQIEFKIRLDRTMEPTPARGQVVWSRGAGDSTSVGVRFMQLPEQMRERMASFLRENSIQSYIPAGSTGISS